MSLLTNSALTYEEAEIRKRINVITATPKILVDQLYINWMKAFDALHGNPNLRPALLTALGTNAKELFELNTVLTQFMITNLQGKRDDLVQIIYNKLATLPQFVYNEDGTVQEVIVPVEPTPEPVPEPLVEPTPEPVPEPLVEPN